MTVYCYRCGGPIKVQPIAKTIEIWDDKRVRVTYEMSIVEHTCAPKDAP